MCEFGVVVVVVVVVGGVECENVLTAEVGADLESGLIHLSDKWVLHHADRADPEVGARGRGKNGTIGDATTAAASSHIGSAATTARVDAERCMRRGRRGESRGRGVGGTVSTLK